MSTLDLVKLAKEGYEISVKQSKEHTAQTVMTEVLCGLMNDDDLVVYLGGHPARMYALN